MIADDLATIRTNLGQLQQGQITPEFFDQFYSEIGGIEGLLEQLLPALEELIKELFAQAVEAQGEDEDQNEEVIQRMLRELGTVAYVAGRLQREPSGMSVAISPDAAVELVRSLLAGQKFGFSFEVKESME